MTGSLVSAGLASSLPRLSKLRCDLAAAVASVCFVEFFLSGRGSRGVLMDVLFCTLFSLITEAFKQESVGSTAMRV